MEAKYESTVTTVDAGADKLYARLSDFESLARFFPSSFRVAQCSVDTCIMEVQPIGRMNMRIVERQPYELVRILVGVHPQIEYYILLHIRRISADTSTVQVAVHADLSPLYHMIASRIMQNTVDEIAKAIARRCVL